MTGFARLGVLAAPMIVWLAALPGSATAAGLPLTSVQQGQGFMSGMPFAAEPAGAFRARQVPVSGDYRTPRPASAPGGLGLSLHPADSVRAGGSGTTEVEVFQRSSPGISARDLRLTLRTQKGLKISGASGDGWICRSRSTNLAVCRGRDASDRLDPGTVKVDLAVGAGSGGADRRLHARLGWRERRDARMVAAGLAKQAPRGSRGARLVSRSARHSEKVQIDRRLKVKLDFAGPQRQPTGDSGMTTVLRARIDAIGGAQVQTRWTQLCTDEASARREKVCGGEVAPGARFLQDSSNPKATDVETMGVDLPDVRDPTVLWFRLEATDGDSVSRDEVKVVAQPFEAAEMDPRLETLSRIDEISRPVAREEMAGSGQRLIAGSISGPGIADVPVGEARTFTVRAGSHRVVSVKWSVARGSGRLLAGARRQGSSVTIRPARALAARSFVLKASARLKGGDRLELAKTIKVLPRGVRASASIPSAGLNSPRLRAGLAQYRRQSAAMARRVDRRASRITGVSIADSSAGSPERTLCAVADVIKQRRLQPLPFPTGPIPLDAYGRPLSPIGNEDTPPDLVLGGGAQVWLGPDARVSRSTCNQDTKITFTTAQLSVGDNSFIDVEGEITTEGLVVKAGSYRIPAQWGVQIPNVREALSKGLRFTVPGAARVSANIDPEDGQWSALGGEIRLPSGLELLSLPGGWKFQPATLRLESTGLISLSVKAVAPTTGEGANGGSVLIEGRMDPLGQVELEVTAANVATIRAADGDQVAFSGGGTLRFNWATEFCEADPATGDQVDKECDDDGETSSPSFTVTPEVWVSAEGQIRLADNFSLTKARMQWRPTEFQADMAARAGSEKSFVDFSVGGTYSSTDDWNFRMTSQSDNWEVVNGLVVQRLEGSVTRTRPDSSRPGVTTIYARAAARGWKPSPAFEVSSLDATLTNECPKDGVVAKECQAGAVRLNLDVKGAAQLPIDGVGAMDWTSTASVNLSTLRFTLSGGVTVPDGGVGPEGLKLRDIQINLSNERDIGVCQPRGGPIQPPNPPPLKPEAQGARLASDQQLNFSLVAKGTVMGQNANFIGDVGNGLCLIGDLRGGMPADAPYSDSFGDAVAVAYSSYDATYNRDGLQFSLDAKRVQLATTFKLPKVVEDNLKLGGTGRFVASVGAARDANGNPTTGNSFDGRISVDVKPGSEPAIFGEKTGSYLGLDGAYLRLVWGAGASTSFTAATQMTYRTKASSEAGDGVGGSATPFRLAVSFAATGATVAGGVDPERSPDRNDKGEPVVNNAFGVQDLKVYGLAISLTLGANTSMGFRGDTALPANWVEPIGIKAGARIALAASVSQTNPCFSFSITNEKGSDQVAVDVANAGLLSANQLDLLLAPSGCTVGDKVIAPGFGFTFNGKIGGQFPLLVQANVQLPSPADPTRFYLYAKLQVPEFSFGSVARFDRTDFELKLDPARQDYMVRLNGGINVLGQRVAVAGDFQSTGGLGNIKLNGSAEANLGVAGFSLDSSLKLKMDMASFNIKTFGFDADMRFRMLGVTLAGARADMLYENGLINRFNFALTAGINVGVASAEGTVRLNYNLLRPSGKAEGPFTEKELKVGFGGKLRFLFWRTAFDWDIYSFRGALDSKEVADQKALADSGSDKQEVEKAPELPLVRVLRNRGLGANQYGRITGITYRTSYRVGTPDTVEQRATSDNRGELLITVCGVDKPNADGTCQTQDQEMVAVVDYPKRTITVLNATAVYGQSYRENYVLEGADWDGTVKWVDAARAAYKAKTQNTLPPLRAWSALAPTSVGYVEYGSRLSTQGPDTQPASSLEGRKLTWHGSAGVGDTQRADWAGEVSWGEAFRRADGSDWPRELKAGAPPGRTTPVTGDFDGDGYGDIGQFAAPLDPRYKAAWKLLVSSGGLNGKPVTSQAGVCDPDNRYCQPIEPPGTPFNPTGTAFSPESALCDGAMYPVTGDWTIDSGTQADNEDRLGAVTLYGTLGGSSCGSNSVALAWELFLPGGASKRFMLGGQRHALPQAAVDRPVTGDWNGDGATDVGVYRPPLSPNETGKWFLYDLKSVPDGARIDILQGQADWTVELGRYGDMPVTGDWNNDGRTGVGVVSYGDRALGSRSPEWQLQDFVDTRCGSIACAPEYRFRFGTYDSYPIVGRWKP